LILIFFTASVQRCFSIAGTAVELTIRITLIAFGVFIFRVNRSSIRRCSMKETAKSHAVSQAKFGGTKSDTLVNFHCLYVEYIVVGKD
jgi:hypothetical protein